MLAWSATWDIHLVERSIELFVRARSHILRWGCIMAAVRCMISGVLERAFLLVGWQDFSSWDGALKLLCLVELEFFKILRVIWIAVSSGTRYHNISCSHIHLGIRIDNASSFRAWMLVILHQLKRILDFILLGVFHATWPMDIDIMDRDRIDLLSLLRHHHLHFLTL